MSHSTGIFRPAIYLSRNKRKQRRHAKNGKCIVGYFASLLSCFAFLSLFAPGSAFTRKFKEFRGLFFVALIKYKILKKCEKCIVSVSYFIVFCENIGEIPVKCEKFIADLTKKHVLVLTQYDQVGPFDWECHKYLIYVKFNRQIALLVSLYALCELSNYFLRVLHGT